MEDKFQYDIIWPTYSFSDMESLNVSNRTCPEYLKLLDITLLLDEGGLQKKFAYNKIALLTYNIYTLDAHRTQGNADGFHTQEFCKAA